MSRRSIVFLPYKLHLRHLLFVIGERMPLTVLLPPEKSLPENSSLKGVRIQYKQFGADILKRVFGFEGRTLKYVDNLSGILDGLNFDVLITCEFYHWYTLQCIAYKKHHPELTLFVISETKRWPRNLITRLIKIVLFHYFKMNLKHVDGVIFYTQAAKDFFETRVSGVKTILLPAPTNATLFKPDTEKEFCKGGQLRLLMNARYSAYKRHRDLFAALAKLREKGKNVHLTCISREEKGKEDMIVLAEQMGVASMVDFIDPLTQEQMPALYNAHDVIVLPSYNEAIGMVIPEAMACGIPTITSDTVGANVYVSKNETGFIFKTGDVGDLVDTIEKCFDPKLLKRMGHAAYERIEQHFTPNAVAEYFIEILLNEPDVHAHQ